MSERKRKIGFTVAGLAFLIFFVKDVLLYFDFGALNGWHEWLPEFARKYQISSKEAFQYLFKFKGIAFIKENYDVEHTLDFETILEDLGILCKKNGGTL